MWGLENSLKTLEFQRFLAMWGMWGSPTACVKASETVKVSVGIYEITKAIFMLYYIILCYFLLPFRCFSFSHVGNPHMCRKPLRE